MPAKQAKKHLKTVPTFLVNHWAVYEDTNQMLKLINPVISGLGCVSVTRVLVVLHNVEGKVHLV